MESIIYPSKSNGLELFQDQQYFSQQLSQHTDQFFGHFGKNGVVSLNESATDAY